MSDNPIVIASERPAARAVKSTSERSNPALETVGFKDREVLSSDRTEGNPGFEIAKPVPSPEIASSAFGGLAMTNAGSAAPPRNDSNNLIQEGSLVLLWFEEETTYLVEVTRSKRVSIHCGKPLLVDEWIGKDFGQKVICDHGVGYLLRPSMEDLMMKASRESGIIYPKDAAFLMMKAGIRSGSKVLEVGTGSGSLTMALAQAVAPSGMVFTYDRRTDLPKNAVKNIKRAGLEAFVSFEQRTAAEPFGEGGFDAATLDIPTPWEEVEVVKAALKPGARLVSLNPTFNQVERMAETLRRAGFIQVECLELLQREILAREGKTRPVQRMVSHTEFLLFAIRVAE